MTRIEKSDAQLDAEAAAPNRRSYRQPPLVRREIEPLSGDLNEMVKFHRQLRRDDSYIEQLASDTPPTTRDPNSGVVRQHEASEIGYNLSARLYRYVEAPMPLEYPWESAFRRLRQWCRWNHKDHTGLEFPYYRGSLCQEAVRLVVKGPEGADMWPEPFSPEQAAEVLQCRISPVLRLAFAYIEASIDDARELAEWRAKEEEGRGPGPIVDPDAPPEPAEWRDIRRAHFDMVARHRVCTSKRCNAGTECTNPVCVKRRAA